MGIEQRYTKNQSTISLAEQERLARAHVLLVGLGGLGGYVLEHLVRVGVGRITACDPDIFEAGNLNRQLLCTEDNIGKSKAEAAGTRLGRINSALKANCLEQPFHPGLLQDVDLVLDCLGGAKDRAFLHESARQAGLPLVSASVAGWTALVSTLLPGMPGQASFGRVMGGWFMGGGLMGAGLSKDLDGAKEEPGMLNGGSGVEESIGTIVCAVNLASCVQSAEAVRLLCGQEPCLAGKVLLADLSSMSFRTLRL